MWPPLSGGSSGSPFERTFLLRASAIEVALLSGSAIGEKASGLRAATELVADRHPSTCSSPAARRRTTPRPVVHGRHSQRPYRPSGTRDRRPAAALPRNR